MINSSIETMFKTSIDTGNVSTNHGYRHALTFVNHDDKQWLSAMAML